VLKGISAFFMFQKCPHLPLKKAYLNKNKTLHFRAKTLF